jgi:hypothetical protein
MPPPNVGAGTGAPMPQSPLSSESAGQYHYFQKKSILRLVTMRPKGLAVHDLDK